MSTFVRGLSTLGWVITFALVAFWSAIVGSWVADRDVPIKFKSAVIINSPVHPGGYLNVQYRITRFENCDTRVERRIKDSQRTWFMIEDTMSYTRGPIGDDVFVVSVGLPNFVSIGPAVYSPTLIFECNPVHRLFPVKFYVPDIPFEVN